MALNLHLAYSVQQEMLGSLALQRNIAATEKDLSKGSKKARKVAVSKGPNPIEALLKKRSKLVGFSGVPVSSNKSDIPLVQLTTSLVSKRGLRKRKATVDVVKGKDTVTKKSKTTSEKEGEDHEAVEMTEEVMPQHLSLRADNVTVERVVQLPQKEIVSEDTVIGAVRITPELIDVSSGEEGVSDTCVDMHGEQIQQSEIPELVGKGGNGIDSLDGQSRESDMIDHIERVDIPEPSAEPVATEPTVPSSSKGSAFVYVEDLFHDLDGGTDLMASYLALPPLAGNSSQKGESLTAIDEDVNLIKFIGPNEATELGKHTVETLQSQLAENLFKSYLLVLACEKGTEHRMRSYAILAEKYTQSLRAIRATNEEKESLVKEKEQLIAEKKVLADEKASVHSLWKQRVHEVSKLAREKSDIELEKKQLALEKERLQKRLEAETERANQNHQEATDLRRENQKLAFDIKSQTKSHEDTIRSLMEDNKRLRKRVGELKAENDQKVAEITSSLESLGKERDASIAELTSKLDSVIKEKDEALRLKEIAEAMYVEYSQRLEKDPVVELDKRDILDEYEVEGEEERDEAATSSHPDVPSSSSVPPADPDTSLHL